jgi:hypothetical protein
LRCVRRPAHRDRGDRPPTPVTALARPTSGATTTSLGASGPAPPATAAEPLGDIELWDLEEPAVAPPMVRPGTAGGAESLSVGDVVFDAEIDVEELAAGLRVGGQWASRRGTAVDDSGDDGADRDEVAFDFSDLVAPEPGDGWFDEGCQRMELPQQPPLDFEHSTMFVGLFDESCVGEEIAKMNESEVPTQQMSSLSFEVSPSISSRPLSNSRLSQSTDGKIANSSDAVLSESAHGPRRRWLRVVSLLLVALALLCVHLWAVPSTQWFDTIAITALVVDALIVQTLYVVAAALMLG